MELPFLNNTESASEDTGRGRMLNDNATGVDHLETSVYAKAIAEQIRITSPPLSFGIFANWGAGKTFLLNQIISILRSQRVETNNRSTKWHLLAIVVVLILILLAAVAVILIINPLYFGIADSHTNVRVVASSVLVFLFVISAACLCYPFGMTKKGLSRFKIVFYAMFTKLPIIQLEKNNENDDDGILENDSKIRYIFVNFNAWKYAGSDNLWAGIVLALVEAVEREFSSITTRLFRGISLQKVAKPSCNSVIRVRINSIKDKVIKIAEEYGKVIECKLLNKEEPGKLWSITYLNDSQAADALQKFRNADIHAELFKNSKNKTKKQNFSSHFVKYAQKHCGVPDLYLVICFVFLIITLPIVVVVFIQLLIQEDLVPQIGLTYTRVVVWLPPIVVIVYIVGNCFLVLYKSQANRLRSLLSGVKNNMANELGFMHQVKNEVEYITDLIHTVEFVYNIKYKVIITIDDLDRIALPKIRLVFEAVHILLSDRSSPFVCLIAVDSRIAVQSLKDEAMPNISEHVYLKKIINIPFSLPITTPDITNYINALAEKTSTSESRIAPDFNVTTKEEDFKKILKEFLSYCRKSFCDKQMGKYLEENPRNIKQIYNMIILTALVVGCCREKEKHENEMRRMANRSNPTDAETAGPSITPTVPVSKQHVLDKSLAQKIVKWVVMTSQWPYRSSYILRAIELLPDAVEDEDDLFSIYNGIVAEERMHKFNMPDEDVLNMDFHANIFQDFVKNQSLTKGDVKSLLKYTINLDLRLRHAVRHHFNDQQYDLSAVRSQFRNV